MNAMFLTSAAALAAALFLFAGTTTTSSFAAPLPSGACCSIGGCCSSASLVQPHGGLPNCFQSTEVECGLGNFYQGDGTLCEIICATTTTTMPPTGACCSILGCCDAPSSIVKPNGVGPGCFESTDVICGLGNTYKGDGSTCEEQCPLPTTTTTSTTLSSVGACCLLGGGCNDLSEKECDGLGVHAGVGSECEFTKCAVPTTTTTTSTTTLPPTTSTTTLPPTTTTTLAVTTTTQVENSICGDANSDGNVTAPDALLALKTAVGSGTCGLERCDYNGDGDVSASDALAILKKAVGQPIPPMCPEP